MTGRIARIAAPLLTMTLALGACVGAGTSGDVARTRVPGAVTGSSAPSAQPGTSPGEPVAQPTARATPGAASVTPTLPPPDPAEPTPIVASGQPAPPLGDLALGERPFDLADLTGHPVLLFFGYTHCPDVCPMTVGELVLVLRERPDVRAVFVTVDPERDTPASLAQWTRYLPEGFVALTGSPSAIQAAADAYGVRYARVDSGSASGYAMSHTASVFLIDSQGSQRFTFPFGTGWASMVRAIDALAEADNGGVS